MKTKSMIIIFVSLLILGGLAYYFLVWKKQKEVELLATLGLNDEQIQAREAFNKLPIEEREKQAKQSTKGRG